MKPSVALPAPRRRPRAVESASTRSGRPPSARRTPASQGPAQTSAAAGATPRAALHPTPLQSQQFLQLKPTESKIYN